METVCHPRLFVFVNNLNKTKQNKKSLQTEIRYRRESIAAFTFSLTYISENNL